MGTSPEAGENSLKIPNVYSYNLHVIISDTPTGPRNISCVRIYVYPRIYMTVCTITIEREGCKENAGRKWRGRKWQFRGRITGRAVCASNVRRDLSRPHFKTARCHTACRRARRRTRCTRMSRGQKTLQVHPMKRLCARDTPVILSEFFRD